MALTLTPSTRRVLHALRQRRDNHGGGFTVTLTTIAEEADVSRRQLFRSLTHLEAAGYVRRDSGYMRGKASTYHLLPREPTREEETRTRPTRPRPTRPISRAHALIKERRQRDGSLREP
jgi:MarR-like DNA-binding transcriptional regulator SgrR of sgrS sRNA